MPFKRFSRMHNKLSELNAQNAHFGASLNRRDFTLSQYGTKLFGYSNTRKILSTSLESQYTVYCRGRCSKHNNQPTPLSAQPHHCSASLQHSLFIFGHTRSSIYTSSSVRITDLSSGMLPFVSGINSQLLSVKLSYSDSPSPASDTSHIGRTLK